MALRNRMRAGGSFELNLTPLLDVVLQLITFFMMLIHFGAKIEGATAGIKLPTTAAALPGRDLGLDRLVVGIDEKGRLIADGASIDPDSSAPWWLDEARKRREGREALGQAAGAGDGADADELPTVVIVRADKRSNYGAVRGALAAAQESGFARFSLIVLKGATP